MIDSSRFESLCETLSVPIVMMTLRPVIGKVEECIILTITFL